MMKDGGSDDSDHEDYESDEEMDGISDEEEEIKEIPLKRLAEKNMKKKRAKMVADNDDLLYGDESGAESDDSDDQRYASDDQHL